MATRSFAFAQPTGGQVLRSATQSISGATATTVNFDSSVGESDADFWAVGDADGIELDDLSPGLWLLSAIAKFAPQASAAGYRQTGISVGGVDYWGPKFTAVNNGGNDLFEVATFVLPITLVAGDMDDTAAMKVYQNSGGALDLATARLTFVRLGDAISAV